MGHAVKGDQREHDAQGEIGVRHDSAGGDEADSAGEENDEAGGALLPAFFPWEPGVEQ